MDKHKAARLQPINDAIDPNKNEPKMIPAGPMEPIQDTSSFVKGPERSGVFSDDNNASAGLTQPHNEPYDNDIKHAV